MKKKDLEFEDMSYYPILKKTDKNEYNDDNYVQVRLLSNKDLPVDLNTGVVDHSYFKDGKEVELETLQSNPSLLRRGLNMF